MYLIIKWFYIFIMQRREKRSDADINIYVIWLISMAYMEILQQDVHIENMTPKKKKKIQKNCCFHKIKDT